jgi:hypothetical protein
VAPSILRQHDWPTNLWFGINSIFFSFLLFSCLLDFHVSPSKFSKQSFNLFFLHIWSVLFWLLLVLFEIIYKIGIFFQILLQFFHFLDLVLIFFIAILLFEIVFKIKFFYLFHPPLVFFSYQIWSAFFYCFFFYFGNFFNFLFIFLILRY